MNEKEIRKIPKFDSEDEEREFWANHDSSDFIDWSKAKRQDFPNLPATAKDTIRGFPMELFGKIVAATFRPKTKLVNLMVYSEDPFGEIQRAPIGDIRDIEPGSWIFLVYEYEIEGPSMNGTRKGSVEILFDSIGNVVEVRGQDLIEAPLELQLIDAAKDGLSAVMQYCVRVGTA